MTYDEFFLSIETGELPHALPLYIQALWYDAKNNWAKAHSLIDSLDDRNSSWVHAYLHRKEGEISNADYWYGRAHKQRPAENLQEEWKSIVLQLLLKS